MGKILKFPPAGVRDMNMDKAFVFFANEAICDSTNEILIDGEDIEKRLERLKKEDSMENRLSLLSGLCYFSEALALGGEDWKEYKVKDGEKSVGYAIFTNVEKFPKKAQKVKYREVSLRYMIKELENEPGETDIYINPGSKDGYIVRLELARYMLKLADTASDFADKQMQKGYRGEELTDVMFERYEWRQVEITLKDKRKIVGEITGCSFGDDPNAEYTVTTEKKEETVYRKEIEFIKEI